MTVPLVATHNVERSLPSAGAMDCLDAVLAEQPDLLGLQEWMPRRWGLLRASGRVRLPGLPAVPGDPTHDWVVSPLGCVVGVRRERYRVLAARWATLGGVVRAERPDRPFGLEPPRIGAVARCRDLETGRDVAVVSYHLAPGVQSGGAYRLDRPRLVRLHLHQQALLQRLVDDLLRVGEVYAVGDANLHRFELRGLTSCWAGRPEAPGTSAGTLGKRRIDDVWGPGPASDVRLLETASDHRAVLARR